VFVLSFTLAPDSIRNRVPALGAMTGLVGAICIFQFTYSLPPPLWLLFEMKKDAAVEDETYTGYGSSARQVDTWHQASRWRRGPECTGGGCFELY